MYTFCREQLTTIAFLNSRKVNKSCPATIAFAIEKPKLYTMKNNYKTC
jgi:hypothetical protein